jgi:hypothetical protein
MIIIKISNKNNNIQTILQDIGVLIIFTSNSILKILSFISVVKFMLIQKKKKNSKIKNNHFQI